MTSDFPAAGVHHLPVLPVEVVQLLSPQPGEIWVDATTGEGGHAQLLLEKIGPQGKLICIDQDATMLQRARSTLHGKAVFFQASFDQLGVVLEEVGVDKVDGVLADLGVCSAQLDDPLRGFSFQREGPMDMRLNPEEGEPASTLVNRLSERELADLFWEYGEERFSRRIARKIVERRKQQPITTTTELADLIRRCVPRPKKHGGSIDPATRVFQALRIATNDELGALKRLLQTLPLCIRAGGRASIISFHSLEDRLVKHAFRERDTWEEITRKPVQATEEEVKTNPRSRSAKLRVARRKGEK